jgi:hypothetical protein
MAKKKPEAADEAVRPQIIDLEAETVTVEQDQPASEPEQQPAPPTPAPGKRSYTAYWLLAALLAGAIGGGWLYRDYLAAYLPTSATTDLANRVATLEAQVKTQNDQLSGIAKSANDSQAKAASAENLARDASTQLQSALESAKSLDARLQTLGSDLAAARSDIETLRNAPPPAATGTSGSIGSGALTALSARVETLEKELASLKSASASPAAIDTTALSQAAADLKARFAAGAPYKAEIDRIALMVPAAAGLEQLAPYAEAGLPDAAGLATELRALAPTLPKPEAESAAEEGFWAALGSIVTVRKIGEVDWQAIAMSAASLAGDGKLAEAITTVDSPEGAKPPGLSQWRERAAARLRLEAALSEFSAAIERQLAASGKAP